MWRTLSRRRSFSALGRATIAVASLLVSTCSFTFAKDYYIAPNGDDEAEGTLAAPWVSAAKFAQIAEPGDTLFARGGVYYAQETVLTRSGTEEKPIVFLNYPNEVPIFDGTDTHWNAKARYPNAFYSDHTNYIRYVTFEGLVVRNYFRGGIHLGSNYVPKSLAQTNDHITVKHCLVDLCGQNGITISYGDFATVENCVVGRTGWRPEAGSWSSNINLYNMVGANNRVIGNVSFHGVDISNLHTDGNGMILDMYEGPTDSGAVVENNLFFENGGVGIAWTRCQRANINNNTLWDNSKEPTYIHPGCGIYFWDAKSDINLRNNVIWQSAGGDALQTNMPLESGTRTNNLVTRQPDVGDPKLSDPSNLDFSPLPGSPAREGGTNADAPAKSVWFDRTILKQQTTGQPIPWFRWETDYDRLTSSGGLARCLVLIDRPSGKTDIGAVARDARPTLPELTGVKAPMSRANLVVNGGFEVPAKQWELAKNAVQTGEMPNRGKASLKIQGTTSWSSSSQILSVKPNTHYVYSAWMRGACAVNMKVVTPDWATIAEGVQIPGEAWTKYEVKFNSGPHSTILVALMDGGNGATFVDSVAVVPE